MTFVDPSFLHLTPPTARAFDDFLDQVEVSRLKKELRNLLLYYLIREHEELPPSVGSFLEDLQFLFELLDAVEKKPS